MQSLVDRAAAELAATDAWVEDRGQRPAPSNQALLELYEETHLIGAKFLPRRERGRHLTEAQSYLYEGMVEAVRRFNGSTKFTTFVGWWYRKAVTDYLDSISMDPIKRTSRRRYSKVAAAIRAKPTATDAELAAVVGVGTKMVRLVRIGAFDTYVDRDSDISRPADGRPGSLLDAYEQPMPDERSEDRQQQAAELLERWTDLPGVVVRLRCDGNSVGRIAADLGLPMGQTVQALKTGYTRARLHFGSE
jgi:DNA-directed RNA polymerase specialized sigma subunit